MKSKTTLMAAATLLMLEAASAPSALAQSRMEGERVGPSSQEVRSRFATDFARQHDRGLLFHADVALAFGSVGGATGLGPAARLGLGWLPWPQVGTSLDAWGTVLGGHSLGAVGPALRYFFVDSAVSLGVRAGIGRLDADGGYDTLLASQLDVAWQPYVSRDWSLGIGLEVGVHGVNVDQNSRAPGGWVLGLRLGTTFN